MVSMLLASVLSVAPAVPPLQAPSAPVAPGYDYTPLTPNSGIRWKTIGSISADKPVQLPAGLPAPPGFVGPFATNQPQTHLWIPLKLLAPPSAAVVSLVMHPWARVYVDGQLRQPTGPLVSFHTPALQPGVAYQYVVKVEIEVNGQPWSESCRVPVRAGQHIIVDTQSLLTRREAVFVIPAPRGN